MYNLGFRDGLDNVPIGHVEQVCSQYLPKAVSLGLQTPQLAGTTLKMDHNARIYHTCI
jgi:hypothetical protein